MKKLIVSLAVALIAVSAFAQIQASDHRERVGVHRHFNHGEHARFSGYRGERGHFRGWRGGFIGEVIILDDGCYAWSGDEWLLDLNCQ